MLSGPWGVLLQLAYIIPPDQLIPTVYYGRKNAGCQAGGFGEEFKQITKEKERQKGFDNLTIGFKVKMQHSLFSRVLPGIISSELA